MTWSFNNAAIPVDGNKSILEANRKVCEKKIVCGLKNRKSGKPAIKKNQSKAYCEVAVTPIENLVFVICQTKKCRPILRAVINCVGEEKGLNQ